MGSSMHALGNEMVDDSSPPLTQPSPSHRLDETLDSMMKIMFQALDNRIQPLANMVERLSNIVDGRTPPRHATSVNPPPPNAIPPLPVQTSRGQRSPQKPYPKPASGGGNSGGPSGSPQGEDNDLGRPSSDVVGGPAPENLHPIATQEKGREMRESACLPEARMKNRKARAKDNVAKANAKVPGAAPTPAKTPSRIAPTFIQVTTAQMLRKQDSAKGFRVAASKAQNRKESGMPRRGNATPQAGTTDVTVIRFGGLENRCYVTVGTFARRGLGSVEQRH